MRADLATKPAFFSTDVDGSTDWLTNALLEHPRPARHVDGEDGSERADALPCSVDDVGNERTPHKRRSSRSASSRKVSPARSMYACVVLKSE